MKVTPKELRRMILNEHKRIKLEKSLRLAVRDEVRGILSEQKGKVVAGTALQESAVRHWGKLAGILKG